MNRNKLPTFIIGGAPRSGTTFLCEALQRHPEIYIAEPFIPEAKVFIGEEKPKSFYYEKYNVLFSKAHNKNILGEKTSYYLESPSACSLIKKYLPSVRMLFIVREPVSRAYSSYFRTKEMGIETLSFSEAIALEGKRLNPLSPDKSYAKPFDYMGRGFYDIFAARYYKTFGKNSVRFFLYEQIIHNPQKLFYEIQEFIGISPLAFEKLNPGIVNALKEKVLPLEPSLEMKLREKILPSVRRFQQLTGLDLSLWGYSL